MRAARAQTSTRERAPARSRDATANARRRTVGTARRAIERVRRAGDERSVSARRARRRGKIRGD